MKKYTLRTRSCEWLLVITVLGFSNSLLNCSPRFERTVNKGQTLKAIALIYFPWLGVIFVGPSHLHNILANQLNLTLAR